LDYTRRFKAQGIPFEIFDSHDSPHITGEHNLVLTTIDQARTKLWKKEIGELNEHVRVARIVFDEGHYAITDNDFRPVLDDVHEVRQFAVQMVVLSATIPPKSEETVRHAFGMMKNTLVIRTPTHRPELEYIVEKPYRNNSAIADRVEAIIRKTEPTMQMKDRILVFVPYLDNGVEISKQLGCEFFCGGAAGGKKTTPEKKEAMYKNWVDGIYPVMVCTNAFGAGNDYSHVPLVIHAGTPRHMMGYVQESSRAGRDKQPSRCIILPRSSKLPAQQEEVDHKGEEDMHNMLFGNNGTNCVNYAITLFNDGHGVRCSSKLDLKTCSRCAVHLNPMGQSGEKHLI
jgi:superfamily II DNA helicase RecQ